MTRREPCSDRTSATGLTSGGYYDDVMDLQYGASASISCLLSS